MPFLVLLCQLLVILIMWLKEKWDERPNPRSYTSEEFDDMHRGAYRRTVRENRYIGRHYDQIKAGKDKKWDENLRKRPFV